MLATKKLKLPDGSIVTAYYVGTLASRMGRSVPCIRYWEDNGVIPRPLFSSQVGEHKRRLYLEEEIQLIVDTASEVHLSGTKTLKDFKSKVFPRIKKFREKYCKDHGIEIKDSSKKAG